MKKIKGIILVLFVLSMFFTLSVDPSIAKVKKTNADTIKIGALGPLAITPGKDMEAGAKLAVDEINDAGGVTVGGTNYDFELIVKTSSHPSTGLPDVETAVSNAEALMDQDDVAAMLGLFRTEVTMAVMAKLDRPFLGVGSTAPIITPYFWRLSPSNGTQLTRSLLELYAFGLASLGVRNVTIVREDAAWSLAMSGSIKAYLNTYLPLPPPYGYGTPRINFTNDIKFAEGATYATVESGLTPIKSTLNGLNVNSIMTIFSGPAGKHITDAWASLNMTQYLAGINVEAQSSTHFAETAGAAYGEITLMGAPPDVNQTTKSGPFRQAYFDKYKELPTYTAGASYDCVYVIKDAIERADSDASADIQAKLATTDYEGAQYQIKFTSEPNVWNHSLWGYPYGHVGYYDNGSRFVIPGVPTDLIVHDLYTESTLMIPGVPYVAMYWVQWQQNGIQKTVFGANMPVATRDIADHIEWPINHADHGYTEPADTPGFELPLVLLVLANFAVIVQIQKRKKR